MTTKFKEGKFINDSLSILPGISKSLIKTSELDNSVLGATAQYEDILSSIQVPDMSALLGATAQYEDMFSLTQVPDMSALLDAAAPYKDMLLSSQVPGMSALLGATAQYENMFSSIKVPDMSALLDAAVPYKNMFSSITAMDKLFETTEKLEALYNPKISSVMDSYNDLVFDRAELERALSEVAHSCVQLPVSTGDNGENNNSSSLVVFNELPFYIKIFLFWVFMQVLTPQVNSISANLLTPHVQRYLGSSDASRREIVNNIQKLSVQSVDTNGLRFVTANNVRLREYASTKSQIMDELVLGQIVTVLSKKRNWIEIEYGYQDEEKMHGWVFTSYTARFKY